MPGAGGRAGPAVVRAVESTQLTQAWLGQPQSCKHERSVPISHLADQPL